MSVKVVLTQMREVCRSWQTFFGSNYAYLEIPPEYSKVVYEKIYIMKTHMGWSFEEVYMLPIALREWFLNKWVEENTKNSK